MVCAPVRSIIPSLKLGDYLSVQAHKPCSISHLYATYSLRIQKNCKIISVKSCISIFVKFSHVSKGASRVVAYLTTLKEIISQTDKYLVILSSKTYVF